MRDGVSPVDTMRICLSAGKDLVPSKMDESVVLGVNGKRSSWVMSSIVLKDWVACCCQYRSTDWMHSAIGQTGREKVMFCQGDVCKSLNGAIIQNQNVFMVQKTQRTTILGCNDIWITLKISCTYTLMYTEKETLLVYLDGPRWVKNHKHNAHFTGEKLDEKIKGVLCRNVSREWTFGVNLKFYATCRAWDHFQTKLWMWSFILIPGCLRVGIGI